MRKQHPYKFIVLCSLINNHWKLLIALMIVHCSLNTIKAQTFPVICRTELQAPYSLYLPDYTQVGSTRLAVNLLLQDNSVSNYAVRLRLVIEGNNLTIQTKPDYRPAPVFLNGGVNERFIGSDLEAYFRSENLLFQGISRTEYERNKRLPEGFYRIRFEVLDYNRDIAVSNPLVSNSTAWLLLNDPPLLNFPMQEEKVRPLPQQSLAFSWTPRHTSSPNAARNVEYEFTLVQLIPNTRNPNDAILNSIPIYQTLTRSTQLVYGIAEPNLILGNRYAWRVRAKELSLDNTTGIDLFKNRGYSEVFAFTYGEPCAMPVNSSAEVLNASRAKISWQTGVGNTAFRVEYRKKEASSSEWAYTSTTQLGYSLVDNLEPNTVYEYQIRGFCDRVGNAATSIQEFTTPALAQEAISCGLPQNNIDLTNLVPNTTLKAGDTLQAADFDVKVTRITNSGGGGRFSGEGLMVFPLANRAKVKVVFENIMVNADNRFVEGRIVVVGMGIQVLNDDMINTVNGLFSEIDALLAQAETTASKIDEVLGKMEQVMDMMIKYLPDDLLQELKSSQAALEQAKDEYDRVINDPNATEEQKAKAKADLKKAREAVKQAYQDAASYWKEALIRFIDIIWETLKELKQEYFGKEAATEQELDIAGEAAMKEIFDKQGVTRPNPNDDISGDDGIFLIGRFKEEYIERPSSPRKIEVETTFDGFDTKQKKLRLVKFLNAMLRFYISPEEVKNKFKDDIGLQGEKIIEDIFQGMKERKTDRQLIDRTKNTIIQNVTEVIEFFTQD